MKVHFEERLRDRALLCAYFHNDQRILPFDAILASTRPENDSTCCVGQVSRVTHTQVKSSTLTGTSVKWTNLDSGPSLPIEPIANSLSMEADLKI